MWGFNAHLYENIPPSLNWRRMYLPLSFLTLPFSFREKIFMCGLLESMPMEIMPFSQKTVKSAICFEGKVAVVPSIDAREPFSSFKMAMPRSSASMFLKRWEIMASADTGSDPMSQTRRSIAWMVWFIKAPPSLFHVPRHAALP